MSACQEFHSRCGVILCISSSPGKPNTLAMTWILGSSPGQSLATLVVCVFKTQWYLFILNTLADIVFLCQWMRRLWQMIWMNLGSSRKTLHIPIFLFLSVSVSVSLCLSLWAWKCLCFSKGTDWSYLLKLWAGVQCCQQDSCLAFFSESSSAPPHGFLIIASYAHTLLPSGH